MKFRKFVLFLSVPFVLANTSVHAQINTWEEIGQIDKGIQCGYFWNRGEGVIATGNGQYYYMKNGLWRVGQKLGSASLVNSIRCFDGHTLYSPVYSYLNFNGYELWKSTDSGVTWNQVPSPINAGNDIGDNGPDVYWNYRTNVPVLFGSTTVRLDSLDIVSTADWGAFAPPYTSRNGGQSWPIGTISGPSFPDGYNYAAGCGACVDQINKLYYAAADGGQPGLFRSRDSGRSWVCLLNLPQNLFMMDDVEGIYDKTFIQTSNGMYETTDSGNTWNSIGGPSRANSDDARFFVFGCTGQAVIAFTDGGGILLMNGWDAPDPAQLQSTFSAAPHECDTGIIIIKVPQNFTLGKLHIAIEGDSSGVFTLLTSDTIQVDSASQQIVIQFIAHDLVQHVAQLSISPIEFGNCPITHSIIGQAQLAPVVFSSPIQAISCTPTSGELIIENPNCEHLYITKDSSESSAIIPQSFDSTVSDTGVIPFTCTPLPMNGFVTDSLFIQGFFQPSNTLFEQTVPIRVIYEYVPSMLAALQTNYDLGSIQECLSSDTSFVIQNTGCDTLYVPLAQDALAAGWTLTPSTGTLELLPGQFDTIHIQFSSLIPGVHDQVLTYNYLGTHSGVVSINLSALVITKLPAVLLSDTAIDLGTRTICANDTTIDVSFTTVGCDSTNFTHFSMGSGSPFQLLNPNDTILPPNGTVHKLIAYHGAIDGSQSQILTVHISRNDGGLGHDTSIQFSVIITGERAALQSGVSSIDVGKTYICQERDTFVVIENVGCDTVCISQVSVVPSTFIVTSSTAFCIAPGEQDTISLRTQVDTTGGALTNNTTLTITSNPPIALEAIQLSRGIEYPVQWGLHLSPPDSAIAGADVTYQVIQSGLLPADITALDFTLTYDDDLLSFVRANEPSVSPGAYVRTADGLAHQSFHVAPVSSDSELTTLHFFPYVTRSSQTAIDLENPVFVSSFNRSQDCIASISVSPSGFTLVPECGYNDLAGFMDSSRVQISSIVPNPAKDAVQISFINPTSSQISYQVFDALGQTRLNGVTDGNVFSLDVSSLPAAMYFFRAANGSGFSASSKLAIVR